MRWPSSNEERNGGPPTPRSLAARRIRAGGFPRPAIRGSRQVPGGQSTARPLVAPWGEFLLMHRLAFRCASLLLGGRPKPLASQGDRQALNRSLARSPRQAKPTASWHPFSTFLASDVQFSLGNP